MKKLFINLSVAGMLAAGLVGCGPSAEEKAAEQQRLNDSIAFVQQAMNDSLMMVQQQVTADSLAALAVADSLRAVAVADSIAASKGKPKPKPKPAPQPTKPEDVKPGQGRG